MNIDEGDQKLITWFGRNAVPLARGVLFVIFFWFGVLKILGVSPATSLVLALYDRTIPFIPFDIFYVSFALFEMLIGILFLIPKATRLVVALLFVHMLTTFLPLVLLPKETWQGVLAPTLEGQYILKNLALIALAIIIAADIDPFARRHIGRAPRL
jgi:uncharacterized membrane protein YphA (DoxX/SURF4 family)